MLPSEFILKYCQKTQFYFYCAQNLKLTDHQKLLNYFRLF